MKKIIGFMGNALLSIYGKYNEIKTRYLIKNLQKNKGCKYLSTRIKINQDELFDILLDLNDKGITLELLTYLIREEENMLNLKEILKENKFEYILDIGANIGYFVLFESKFSNCKKIYALEPVKRNYNLLKINCLINDNFEKIITINKGIGEKNEQSIIYVPEEGNQASLLLKNNFSHNVKKERISLITLESLINKYNISLNNVLIRMDIEGYEYNFVKNNLNLLKNMKNSWYILEFHPHIIGIDKSIDFINMLESCDFELNRVVIDYPIHISSLGNLKELGKMFFKWRIGNRWVGTISKISFDELKKAIKNNKLTKTPHLYLYKK